MNENINMQIIRYFASKYPNLVSFIYRTFAGEIKKLNLQELSFNQNPIDEQMQSIIDRLKHFNQDVLEQFHQLSKSKKDLKSFCKEILSQILTITME